MKSGLEGILAAIKHLYSFGLIHNDINPANIILNDISTFILIDFNSYRSIGESFRDTETKRTRH
ncbi:Protein kinase-like domain [Penicillium roqueforti FM164]|uniref:Protein kinase-like domain n=1 Tax=Penicillium roqueforti (strain FM164) TaxID=1365484 RepID=W6QRD1_PENRF|nr:Protein kinase-like domain [Penicillium roqueforti FM164]